MDIHDVHSPPSLRDISLSLPILNIISTSRINSLSLWLILLMWTMRYALWWVRSSLFSPLHPHLLISVMSTYSSCSSRENKLPSVYHRSPYAWIRRRCGSTRWISIASRPFPLPLPLFPCSSQAVLHWTYVSLSRGPNSLFEKLKQSMEDPSQYISVCSLRTHDVLCKRLVRKRIQRIGEMKEGGMVTGLWTNLRPL